MHWRVQLSEEVNAWYQSLGTKAAAQAQRALERLEERGSELRMPYSRSLNDGLFELRFSCGLDQSQRITYYFDSERAAIVLTTFVKQRKNERREVQRAHRAMRERKERSQ